MTDEERYLFDLNGYLVLKGAIHGESLAKMNAWLDAQAERDPKWLGQTDNMKLENLLTWGPEFLALLDNPRVLPYLKELLGPQLRLDHDYAMFLQPGGDGLYLHGGGTPFDQSQFYHFCDGKMYNGLTVAVYSLSDVLPGEGGFCCIPGSHKANYLCPLSLRTLDPLAPTVVQVPVNAGDCIVFTEALMHGTIPWRGDRVRRTLYYKYSPAPLTWETDYYIPGPGNPGVQALLPELNEAQRLLIQPPGMKKRRNVP